MAKKSSGVSKVSSGKMAGIRKAREEKRQAKFAAKRENGVAYKYQPNPYKEGTKEWNDERMARAEKSKSSRTEYAQWSSINAKLDNELHKQELENKKAEKAVKKSSK